MLRVWGLRGSEVGASAQMFVLRRRALPTSDAYPQMTPQEKSTRHLFGGFHKLINTERLM